MADLAFYNQFRQTPAGQGLLRAIRFAEGTAGPKGYQTMFGGGTFSDLKRHPDRVIRSGGYSSAAAGAYQFLPGTWQGVASRLKLPSFEPQYQDIGALELARQRLLPIGGLSVLEKEGLSPRVAAALAPEWASFPTMSGSSYYGQPVKKLEAIQQAFAQGKSSAPVAASTGTTAKPPAAKNTLTDMLKKLVLEKYLFSTQPESSAAGFLSAYMRGDQPASTGADILATSLLTPRSPYLNALTQFR